MSDVYKKQIGGDHYQSMKIQPSEFINKITCLLQKETL
jgi:hypothetical protein